MLLLFFVMTLNSFAQQSSKKLLWKSVEPCYSLLEKSGNSNDNQVIEDIKNGYLKVAGPYPTCGCYCETSVAAFKTAKGNLVTLIKEDDACYFKYRIASNKNIQDIFPKEVSISAFIPKADASRFYFDTQPPQKGTDITITVKPIPLGIENTNKTPFDYKANTKIENLEFFKRLVHKINDDRTLDFLLKKDYKAIDKKDLSLIKEESSREGWNFVTISSKLTKLYNIYQYFESRQYDSFVLGWHRESGKFYIKKKIKKQQSVTFLQFLKENKFWIAFC